MQTITVEVPASIATMAPALEEFVRGMVFKLTVNSWKSPPERCDIDHFMRLIFQEVIELHRQFVIDKDDPNLFREAHDVANFAFLLTVSLGLERSEAVNPKQRKML